MEVDRTTPRLCNFNSARKKVDRNGVASTTFAGIPFTTISGSGLTEQIRFKNSDNSPPIPAF